MGMAIVIGALLAALAIIVVTVWGGFEALVRISRFLWRLLTEA